MSTPAQILPPQFGQTMPPPTAASPKAERSTLQQYRREIATVRRAQEALKAAKAAASKAKSAKAKKAAQARVATLTARLRAAEKTRTTAQTRYYQASGQWDKLLRGDQRDSFLALRAMFEGFGLGSLAGKIFDYVKQGYDPNTISLLLQDSKEYKERFAANEARAKAGLGVLSPAEYLAVESAYRQILSAAGLPRGFYDSPTDFTHFLAADLSPTELKARADLASQKAASADPQVRQALRRMYGVSEGDIVAYFLDQKRALPILERQAQAAEIGAAALRRGFEASRSDLERYASLGIGGDQAEEGFARIRQTYEPMTRIAERYGLAWGQRQAEAEVFEGDVRAGTRLRSQERAQFGGRAGSARVGLSAPYRQT